MSEAPSSNDDVPRSCFSCRILFKRNSRRGIDKEGRSLPGVPLTTDSASVAENASASNGNVWKTAAPSIATANTGADNLHRKDSYDPWAESSASTPLPSTTTWSSYKMSQCGRSTQTDSRGIQFLSPSTSSLLTHQRSDFRASRTTDNSSAGLSQRAFLITADTSNSLMTTNPMSADHAHQTRTSTSTAARRRRSVDVALSLSSKRLMSQLLDRLISTDPDIINLHDVAASAGSGSSTVLTDPFSTRRASCTGPVADAAGSSGGALPTVPESSNPHLHLASSPSLPSKHPVSVAAQLMHASTSMGSGGDIAAVLGQLLHIQVPAGDHLQQQQQAAGVDLQNIGGGQVKPCSSRAAGGSSAEPQRPSPRNSPEDQVSRKDSGTTITVTPHPSQTGRHVQQVVSDPNLVQHLAQMLACLANSSMPGAFFSDSESDHERGSAGDDEGEGGEPLGNQRGGRWKEGNAENAEGGNAKAVHAADVLPQSPRQLRLSRSAAADLAVPAMAACTAHDASLAAPESAPTCLAHVAVGRPARSRLSIVGPNNAATPASPDSSLYALQRHLRSRSRMAGFGSGQHSQLQRMPLRRALRRSSSEGELMGTADSASRLYTRASNMSDREAEQNTPRPVRMYPRSVPLHASDSATLTPSPSSRHGSSNTGNSADASASNQSQMQSLQEIDAHATNISSSSSSSGMGRSISPGPSRLSSRSQVQLSASSLTAAAVAADAAASTAVTTSSGSIISLPSSQVPNDSKPRVYGGDGRVVFMPPLRYVSDWLSSRSDSDSASDSSGSVGLLQGPQPIVIAEPGTAHTSHDIALMRLLESQAIVIGCDDEPQGSSSGMLVMPPSFPSAQLTTARGPQPHGRGHSGSSSSKRRGGRYGGLRAPYVPPSSWGLQTMLGHMLDPNTVGSTGLHSIPEGSEELSGAVARLSDALHRIRTANNSAANNSAANNSAANNSATNNSAANMQHVLGLRASLHGLVERDSPGAQYTPAPFDSGGPGSSSKLVQTALVD